MGFFKSKGYSARTSTDASPYLLSSPQFMKDGDSAYSSFDIGIADIEKKDVKYKRRIRVLRFIFRCMSLVLSAFMIGTLSYTLVRYFATCQKEWEGTDLWGGSKVLWPTYLILSISAVTLLLNVVTIIAYFRDIKLANTAGDLTIYIGWFMLAVELIVWAVSSSLYKITDTGTDLWGYSCGKKADKILQKAQDFVDFGMLCTAQNGTWFTTIIQVILHILTVITMVFVWRRSKGKKRVASFRASQISETRYDPNAAVGAVSKPKGWRRYLPLSGTSSKH